jgi:hypothetical protein
LLLSVIRLQPRQLRHRLVLPVAIQNWSLTSLQQRRLKTRGARSARPVLHAAARRKLLDRGPLSADSPAHRAAGVATDVIEQSTPSERAWRLEGDGHLDERVSAAVETRPPNHRRPVSALLTGERDTCHASEWARSRTVEPHGARSTTREGRDHSPNRQSRLTSRQRARRVPRRYAMIKQNGSSSFNAVDRKSVNCETAYEAHGRP